jgi:DNA-binding transcriptional LysR family regulator
MIADMNIHHLELFYYVARHGGISEGVRNIPYGIQQPAVSGQIAQLEEFLGTTLFQRRPFLLTPAGEKLYQFIEPFFSRIDGVASELQGGTSHQIRIGASDIILRDHLPEVLTAARKKFPRLKITLRDGYQPELEGLLMKQEIDLAVTVIEKKPPTGIQSQALLELPLILVAPKDGAPANAEELWQRDRIAEPLICLPASETMCKNFQQGLHRLGVDWFPGIEVSSVDMIETYVANGFGIGLSVSIPKTKLSPKVCPVALSGFAPVILGALWRGRPTPPIRAVLEEMQARARYLQG